jgi:hypothetical protein
MEEWEVEDYSIPIAQVTTSRASGMDHLSPDPDNAPVPHNSVFLKIAGFDDCPGVNASSHDVGRQTANT